MGGGQNDVAGSCQDLAKGDNAILLETLFTPFSPLNLNYAACTLKALGRLERCIVTIASLDQWLATIENHRHQWLTEQKTIEKPLVPMVEQLPFHQ